jgi:hypothetical protein
MLAAGRDMCRALSADPAGVPHAGINECTYGTSAAVAAAGELLQQEGQVLQQGQEEQQGQQQEQQPPQRQQWQQTPVVGMLKLTREKGSELFLALAAHLPHLRFKAVCADPQLLQQVAQTGCSNVQLVQPVGKLCWGLLPSYGKSCSEAKVAVKQLWHNHVVYIVWVTSCSACLWATCHAIRPYRQCGLSIVRLLLTMAPNRKPSWQSSVGTCVQSSVCVATHTPFLL